MGDWVAHPSSTTVRKILVIYFLVIWHQPLGGEYPESSASRRTSRWKDHLGMGEKAQLHYIFFVKFALHFAFPSLGGGFLKGYISTLCCILLCSLVSIKKKPEYTAYQIGKNKPTMASFLSTSDDGPTCREGARPNFEPQHRQFSAYHRSGLLPLAGQRFSWNWTRVRGSRAGPDPKASLSDVSMMIIIYVCDFASQETCLCDYLCVVQ
jgi:hypothetical protein